MRDVNGCCWPRFQLRPLGRLGSLARRILTSTHLAPSFVSRGGAAIQIVDVRYALACRDSN